MSLGGTIEPLVKSLSLNQPEIIVFLTSHDSTALAGDILKRLPYKPTVYYENTESPNVMLECYRKACNCVDRTRRMDMAPEDVIIDYTGGTKVMTAALILATIGQPFHFNYVGGEQRTKNGLGTVVDGHEKMYEEMNPWSIFAEEERRQIVTLFNRRRFSAVLQIIDACRNRELPADIMGYFSFVRPISEGYLLWEQFNHKAAKRKLAEGLTLLAEFCKVHRNPAIEAFGSHVEENLLFLEQLLSETEAMRKLHPILIDDLMNNAWRRMADKRYDDAAARIYRTLELYGQVNFEETAGCPTDAVTPDVIPEEIRKDFVKKYRDNRKNTLKLPMTATFEYLKRVGHPAGVRFFERHKKIKDVQSNRNSSILAHGIKPVTETAINSIFSTVSECVGFENIFDLAQLP